MLLLIKKSHMNVHQSLMLLKQEMWLWLIAHDNFEQTFYYLNFCYLAIKHRRQLNFVSTIVSLRYQV